MRRTAIAAAWLFGATVPLLAGVVLVFGCCVLPFHAYIHKAMPLCHLAIGIMSGEHAGHDAQPMPAREKQEPVKRMATEVPRSWGVAQTLLSVPSPWRHRQECLCHYRSFISLGALRCDQDVGLHLLTGRLLI